MVKVIIEPPCFGLEKIFVPDSYVDLMIFYVCFLVMGKLMPTSCGTIPESGKVKIEILINGKIGKIYPHFVFDIFLPHLRVHPVL